MSDSLTVYSVALCTDRLHQTVDLPIDAKTLGVRVLADVPYLIVLADVHRQKEPRAFCFVDEGSSFNSAAEYKYIGCAQSTKTDHLYCLFEDLAASRQLRYANMHKKQSPTSISPPPAEDAAEPAQTAAVDPICQKCRWWMRTDRRIGRCYRYPTAVTKDEYDLCGEFKSKETA